MNPILMDLHNRIVEAYDAGEGTRQEIAERFKVSVHMVKKLLSQRGKLVSLDPQVQRCGRKPLFEQHNYEWLRKSVAKQPDITLEELLGKSSKPCFNMTIFRALRKLKALYKKTPETLWAGRDAVVMRRQQWQQAIAWGLTTERLVLIDESSAKTNMTRLYGWAFDGARLIDAVPHGHWYTTSMIAVVDLGGAKAPFVLKTRWIYRCFVRMSNTYVALNCVPEIVLFSIV